MDFQRIIIIINKYPLAVCSEFWLYSLSSTQVLTFLVVQWKDGTLRRPTSTTKHTVTKPNNTKCFCAVKYCTSGQASGRLTADIQACHVAICVNYRQLSLWAESEMGSVIGWGRGFWVICGGRVVFINSWQRSVKVILWIVPPKKTKNKKHAISVHYNY